MKLSPHGMGASVYSNSENAITRYDLPAQEPSDPDPQHPAKNWSLINRINQKGLRPRDNPVLLTELPKDDLEFIYSALPELRNRKG